MFYEGKNPARLMVPALLCVFIVLFPDPALADEVSTAYIINKDDVSGWVMVLVRIAIGGVIMFAAGKIANWWFY